MCGFAGELRFDGCVPSRALVERMADVAAPERGGTACFVINDHVCDSIVHAAECIIIERKLLVAGRVGDHQLH